jgi:anti-anti-sigma factor
MHLSERHVGGVTVIDVATGVAGNDAAMLREGVKSALEHGDRRILLNLAQFRDMDSTCLGEVFASYKATAAVGGVLKLAQPDPHVRRVLQMTKVDTFIEVHESEANAIASFDVSGSPTKWSPS